MVNNPKISIYILNHNYGRFLTRAVESVLAQTTKETELLLIDDGSTDNSRDIIVSLASQHGIHSILHPGQGFIASCNLAVTELSGHYMLRLDADDELEPNAIETMVHYAQKFPEADWIFPGFYYMDKHGQITGKENRGEAPFFISANDKPPHGACSLIKRSTLLQLGGYSTHITCRDGLDLFLKLKGRGTILSVPEYLFKYRRHGENLTEDSEMIERNERILLGSVGVVE